MATVAVIFGGMAGFFSALVSLIVFNAGWLLALGIWAIGGFAVALVLVALAMMPRHTAADAGNLAEMDAEHA